MADATLKVFRGNKDGGQNVEYKVPVAPGWWCWMRCITFRAFGAGLGGALELQGREVRFVFGGGERAAAADVQDAHGFATAERGDSGDADKDVPSDQRCGHRRFLEL